MKIILIIVSIIGLSAVIGAVVVGTRSFDGTVVDKPYEQGLAYDAARQEKEASGLNVEVMSKAHSVGANDILFSVIDKNGRRVSDAEVSVFISRPSSSSYDKTYKAATTDQGLFRIAAELPLYGYWSAKVQVATKKSNIVFEKTLFAEQREKL